MSLLVWGRRHPHRLVSGTIALMAAEVVVMVGATVFGRTPASVRFALAADMVLLSALALWVIGGPRALGSHWPSVLRTALGTAVWSEIRLIAAAGALLTRRPLRVPAPSATVFRPMLASQSGWVIPFLVLATGVEMPALHVFLARGIHAPLVAHLVVAAANVYGLVWLLGDRRLMQESMHQLGAETLELRLGLRCAASIPWTVVERVVPLETHADRERARPRSGRRFPSITPIDPPNVHLCLREEVTFRTYFGIARRARHVNLFVDRPDVFRREVERRAGLDPASGGAPRAG